MGLNLSLKKSVWGLISNDRLPKISSFFRIFRIIKIIESKFSSYTIFQYFKHPLRRHLCNYEIDMSEYNNRKFILLTSLSKTLTKTTDLMLIYDLKCVSIYCNVLQYIKNETFEKKNAKELNKATEHKTKTIKCIHKCTRSQLQNVWISKKKRSTN